MQQNTMYLPHKGEMQRTNVFYHTMIKYQNTMYLPHKGEIQQNVASIARGRNATKTQCIDHTRVKNRKTMHQSQKEEMQQRTMYISHKGEVPQNIARIAQGRNTIKHNVFISQR